MEGAMQGRATDRETVYKVMKDWYSTGEYASNRRAEAEFGVSGGGYRSIVRRNLDNPDFDKLKLATRAELARNVLRVANKTLLELERRIDEADTLHIQRLAAVFDVLYDKWALASGSSTANENLHIKIEYE
jgi:hypothetical protein